MAIVWTQFGRRAVAGELVPWLSTLQLRLFVAPAVLTPELQFLDFTEASFDGYAPQTLTLWSGNFLNAAGQGEVDEVIHTFTVAVGGGSDTIKGYFVTDAAGNVMWAELDPSGPVPMIHAGQTYSLIPRVMVGELC